MKCASRADTEAERHNDEQVALGNPAPRKYDVTPLDKGEALFDELVDHYGGADGREVGPAT